MSRVVVGVDAHRASHIIEETLAGIKTQELPAEWTAEVSVHVAPNASHPRDCGTWVSAVETPGVTPHLAPLDAVARRHRLYAHGFSGRADVVVAWDATAVPAHDGVLAALLAPYALPNVAATTAPLSPDAPTRSLGGFVARALSRSDASPDRLSRRLSSLSRYGWEQAGPYDGDGFTDRLSRTGLLLPAPGADTAAHERVISPDSTVGRAFARF